MTITVTTHMLGLAIRLAYPVALTLSSQNRLLSELQCSLFLKQCSSLLSNHQPLCYIMAVSCSIAMMTTYNERVVHLTESSWVLSCGGKAPCVDTGKRVVFHVVRSSGTGLKDLRVRLPITKIRKWEKTQIMLWFIMTRHWLWTRAVAWPLCFSRLLKWKTAITDSCQDSLL